MKRENERKRGLVIWVTRPANCYLNNLDSGFLPQRLVRWTSTTTSTTMITSITTTTKTTSKFLNKLILIQESHCHIITDYYLAENIAGTDGALIAVADAVRTRQRWWLRREGNMEISSSWPALGLQMMENLGNHRSHCGPCGKTYLAFTCIINKYN